MRRIAARGSLVVVGLLTAGLAACKAGPTQAPEISALSELCVVRHAEAFKNLDPRPPGLDDAQLDTLTPAGEAQARALVEHLPDGVVAVWASPTNRTRQTARLLAPEGVRVMVRDDLASLAGDATWAERIAAAREGEDLRPEGGESMADGQLRAVALLEELRAQLPHGRHAVLVTHGDFAPIILGELRGSSLLERPSGDALEPGELRCEPLAGTPAHAP